MSQFEQGCLLPHASRTSRDDGTYGSRDRQTNARTRMSTCQPFAVRTHQSFEPKAPSKIRRCRSAKLDESEINTRRPKPGQGQFLKNLETFLREGMRLSLKRKSDVAKMPVSCGQNEKTRRSKIRPTRLMLAMKNVFDANVAATNSTVRRQFLCDPRRRRRLLLR